MPVNIHSSAIVDQGAKIGDQTYVWHFSHVCSGAKIGKNCSIGQNVYIANDVIIGNNVKIQNNVSIYDSVIISDNVFCGPSMVFTNVYNPRSEYPRKTEYKKTFIDKGASLGANCTIICGVKVGQYSMIGAGAVVNKDVPNFALMVGVPAKQIGWISRSGQKLIFSGSRGSEAVCSETKEVYVLLDGVCSLLK